MTALLPGNRIANLGNLIAFLVALGSCSTGDKNHAYVYKLNLPYHSEQCANILELSYAFHNPSNPWGQKATLRNDNLIKFFTPQQDTKMCYAAALSTAFKYGGYNYTQEDFIRPLEDYCWFSQNSDITLPQLIYALTKRHVGDGIWYIDTPNDDILQYLCRLVPLASDLPPCNTLYPSLALNKWNSLSVFPNFYKPVTWYRNKHPNITGGLFPIFGTDDLVEHFKHGAPILVGMRAHGIGHVVILTALTFRGLPDEFLPLIRSMSSPASIGAGISYEIAGNTFQVPRNQPTTHIDSVEFLNPANSNTPIYQMDGDLFFENTTFMLAIYPG